MRYLDRLWSCFVAHRPAFSFRNKLNIPGGETTQVYLKPDLTATSFSAQNGYFFANMSKLAYKTPEEVESTLEEMEDCKGLQYNFQWFQVGVECTPRLT